ncbi:hypothetical protein RJ639_038471 [Escallonia herrerae]|uniref:Uncharacterized protein n=1 Tax=Escallonia herrerae TaxID=1293975 RepID=A0AA89B6Q1_9ASTE|nr:hypothetical protein RJ639_038471 [Escallonia herrerae]
MSSKNVEQALFHLMQQKMLLLLQSGFAANGITFKPPLPKVLLANRYKKPHTPHDIVYFKLPAPSDPLALKFSSVGCGIGLGLDGDLAQHLVVSIEIL